MTKGECIRQLRLNLGMTQTEVAAALRTTKQTIYKYESGKVTNIPTDRIKALADLFSVSPGYITGWEKEKPAAITGGRLAELGLSDDSLDRLEDILSWVDSLSEESWKKLRDYVSLLVNAQRSDADTK